MSNSKSLKKIRRMQKELNNVAFRRDNNLTDNLVYKKSCDLDKIIVEYMKTNKQMEIFFK